VPRVLAWALVPVEPLGPDPLVAVCSSDSREEFAQTLPDEAELVVQPDPRGTGDAVAAAKPTLLSFSGDVLVLDGAAPLLTTSVLEELVAEHRRTAASVTVLSIEPAEPLPYGRVLRNDEGGLRAIVAEADASPAERAVRELNASIYVFKSEDLWPALDRVEAHNVQGELYLTDAVLHLVADGKRGAVYRAADPIVGLGINNRAELAQAAGVLRARVLEEHMLAGVTIVDPGSTWIDADVQIEPDAVIQPFTILSGQTVVRAGAQVGPHVVAVDSEIGPGANVGPFSYLRPGTVLGAGVKVGAFVEVKNSRIGERTKVPHLSYIGGAEGPSSRRTRTLDRARSVREVDALLGPLQPRAGRPHRGATQHRARRSRARDICERRDLLPLQGVDPGRRRLHRAVLLWRGGQQPPDGAHDHGAVGEARLGQPDHRRDALVSVLAPG